MRDYGIKNEVAHSLQTGRSKILRVEGFRVQGAAEDREIQPQVSQRWFGEWNSCISDIVKGQHSKKSSKAHLQKILFFQCLDL